MTVELLAAVGGDFAKERKVLILEVKMKPGSSPDLANHIHGVVSDKLDDSSKSCSKIHLHSCRKKGF
jgi:hypothetical protein